MKLIGIIALSCLAVLILLEGGLRLILGLGKRPIYLPDPEIGYLLAPNQDVYRLGKRTIINQYSMRSQPITEQRSSETLRILMLGDSIINGNWWTDQNETLPELIEKQLNIPNFNKIEVLNASANSWSPRNQLAYLRRFGTFESQLIILVINTDDFFGRKPTDLGVGKELNYPDHQPNSAIGEILERVFYRRPSIKFPKETGDIMGRNLEAMEEIQKFALQSNAQFLLVATPLLREVDQSDPREYEKKARIRLHKWAKENNIELIDFLPSFQQIEPPDSLYRDHIHLSREGEKIVSDTLAKILNQKLREFVSDK